MFARSPSLNNSGTVAFRAFLDTGEDGIFTGPDPLADKVIGTGDPLFGSTVTSSLHRLRIAQRQRPNRLHYGLADGRLGIARADPLVIPEPGTLSLLVAALLGAMLWRRDKSSAGSKLTRTRVVAGRSVQYGPA